MFPNAIETDSLRLVPFTPENVDEFELYELFARTREDVAAVFEHVPQEPYDSVKEAHDQLTEAQSAWDDSEAAQFAVYTTEDELAGFTGLFLEWKRRTGRIGFILGSPYWGRGYAGESATALTELAFDRLDLELVSIGYEDGNQRSERAVEKYIGRVGGQYDGCLRNWTPLGETVADHHRYTVTRAEYSATEE